MAPLPTARPSWATRIAVISLTVAAIFLPIGLFLLIRDGLAFSGFAPTDVAGATLWDNIVFDSSVTGLGALLAIVGVGLLSMRRWAWFVLVAFIPVFMLASAYELLMGMASRPLSLVVLLGTCAYLLFVLFRPAVRALFH